MMCELRDVLIRVYTTQKYIFFLISKQSRCRLDGSTGWSWCVTGIILYYGQLT